jgi:hypothetical protein
MGKTLTAALALALITTAAQATTVTSNTIDGICNAVVTLYGSPARGGQVVLYHGALARGTIALQVYPNEGNRVCYSRAVDPHHCTGAMTPEVCAPVTSSAGDVLDIR